MAMVIGTYGTFLDPHRCRLCNLLRYHIANGVLYNGHFYIEIHFLNKWHLPFLRYTENTQNININIIFKNQNNNIWYLVLIEKAYNARLV